MEQERDIITKLYIRNLHHVLERIFLALSITDLRVTRLVCRTWLEYIKNELWRRESSLRALKNRLDRNWLTEKHQRIEMKVEDIPCRENCSLNGRECDCPLVWESDHKTLVVLLNTKVLSASYNNNDKTQFTQTKQFNRQQYQVRFVLKKELKLDSSSFLSRPVFFRKKSPVKKVKTIGQNYMEIDSKFIRILDRNKKEEISRFIPYTGWGDNKPVRKISFSSDRLAALISGRVFVYCCKTLIDTNSDNRGALLLVGTRYWFINLCTCYEIFYLSRQTQPPVEDFVLGPNYLLTVGGNTVVLFDFWSGNPSSYSEFFS